MNQLTLHVPGDLLDSWLIEELERRGYERPVKKDAHAWEKPYELSRRLGKHANWLCHVLHFRGHPGIELERGPKGRVIRARSNSAFDAWARQQ